MDWWGWVPVGYAFAAVGATAAATAQRRLLRRRRRDQEAWGRVETRLKAETAAAEGELRARLLAVTHPGDGGEAKEMGRCPACASTCERGHGCSDPWHILHAFSDRHFGCPGPESLVPDGDVPGWTPPEHGLPPVPGGGPGNSTPCGSCRHHAVHVADPDGRRRCASCPAGICYGRRI